MDLGVMAVSVQFFENIGTMACVIILFLLHFPLANFDKKFGVNLPGMALFSLLALIAVAPTLETGGFTTGLILIPLILAAVHIGVLEAALVGLLTILIQLACTNASWIGLFTAPDTFVQIFIPIIICNGLGTVALHVLIRYLQNNRRMIKLQADAATKYRCLVEGSHVGIFIVQGTKLMYANQALTTITTLSHLELLTIDNIYDFIHPDDQQTVHENIEKQVHGGITTINHELRLVKDDLFRHVEVRCSYIKLDGKPAFIGTMIDITKHKQTEIELRQNKARLRAIIAAIPDTVTVIDTNGVLHEIFSPEKSPPPPADQLLQTLSITLTSQYAHTFEYEIKNKGTWEVRLSAINSCEVVSIARDITTYKQTEENYRLNKESYQTLFNSSTAALLKHKLVEQALRESEARFRYLGNHMPLMLWMDDLEGNCVFTNRKWQEYTGSVFKIGMRLPWENLVHPNDQQLIKNTLKSALSRQAPFNYEFRMLRSDGEYRWVQSVGIPRHNSDDTFAGYIGCCLDIHDKKLAEKVLTHSYRRLEKNVEEQSRQLANTNATLAQEIFVRRAMEKRYRKLFDSVQDAIFVWKITPQGLPGSIIEVNDVACQRLSYTRDELLSLSMLTLISKKGQATAAVRMEKLLATRQAIFEFEYVAKDGRVIPSEVNVHLFALGGELVGLCIARDISDRKQAEIELIAARKRISKTEKLAYLGNMAAGIAHEINQPLNSIKVTADSILLWLEEGQTYSLGEFTDDVRTISEQAARIANIIKYIRDLIRNHQQANNQQFSMTKAITNAAMMMTPQLNAASIFLSLELADDSLETYGSLAHMEHVILNLINNALDSLEPSPQTFKEIEIRTQLEDKIIVQISDNGPGIPDSIKRKMFTPFFTTKSYGMGIGLAIAKSVVTSHGGQITIDNNEQAGATFRLEFPLPETDNAKEGNAS